MVRAGASSVFPGLSCAQTVMASMIKNRRLARMAVSSLRISKGPVESQLKSELLQTKNAAKLLSCVVAGSRPGEPLRPLMEEPAAVQFGESSRALSLTNYIQFQTAIAGAPFFRVVRYHRLVLHTAPC